MTSPCIRFFNHGFLLLFDTCLVSSSVHKLYSFLKWPLMANSRLWPLGLVSDRKVCDLLVFYSWHIGIHRLSSIVSNLTVLALNRFPPLCSRCRSEVMSPFDSLIQFCTGRPLELLVYLLSLKNYLNFSFFS
jgi:hypothetical protein